MRGIKYMGEVTNTWMDFNALGLPPSIAKLLARTKPEETKEVVSQEQIPKAKRDQFKHFIAFMAKDKNYLIPVDSNTLGKSIISEELLQHIAHGRARAVQNYDYS